MQAIQAEQDGADRIELCKNLELDGLTPDVNVIKNTLISVNYLSYLSKPSFTNNMMECKVIYGHC